MQRGLMTLLALFVIAASGPARAQADAPAQGTPATGENTLPVAHAAPGGGDMVILPPASRYVTRARRDRLGTVEGTCRHEGTTGTRATESE